MNLTLFDLDNTLLNGDSDFEWSQFLIRIGILERELFELKNQTFYDQYKAGTLDIQEFLDFQLKPLSRHSRKTLDVWHQQFMAENILPIITPSARDLVGQVGGGGRGAHPSARRAALGRRHKFHAGARRGEGDPAAPCGDVRGNQAVLEEVPLMIKR